MDLHLIGDQIAIEMSQNLFFQRFPEIQIERVHRAQHAHIGDDLALLGEDRRLLAVEHFQRSQIVGEHALQDRTGDPSPVN